MPAAQISVTEYYNQLFDLMADSIGPSKEDDQKLLLLPTELYKPFLSEFPTVNGSKASMYEHFHSLIESDSYKQTKVLFLCPLREVKMCLRS